MPGRLPSGKPLLYWALAPASLNFSVALTSKSAFGNRLNIRVMAGTVDGAGATVNAGGSITVGVLDALEIDRAHVCGASMGGMIAQVLAAKFPQRMLSLTSIMSTSGNRRVSKPTKAARKVLLARRGARVCWVMGDPVGLQYRCR